VCTDVRTADIIAVQITRDCNEKEREKKEDAIPSF